MRIIVDIPVLPETHSSMSGNFLQEQVFKMAERYSQHSFIFIARTRFPAFSNLPANISVYHPNKFLIKWFGRKFGERYLLTKELKKLKGDLYLTADNPNLVKTRIPVFLFLMHATEHLQTKGNLDSTAKKQLRSIQKADTLLTFSRHDQQLLAGLIKNAIGTIKSVFPHPGDVPELKWTEKEMTKIEFSGRIEYFAFAGDLDERYDLITLLKSFSLFKKWQQSNMRLIIAGPSTSSTGKFKTQLASFKYRDDVHLILNPPKADLVKIISAAYAVVHPAIHDNFPFSILIANQTGIPVIASALDVCKEWCGENLMYPETPDAAGFAACMQLMYKDERQRAGYISSAKEEIANLPELDLPAEFMNFFEETVAKQFIVP